MTNNAIKLICVVLVSCAVIGSVFMLKAGAFDFGININSSGSSYEKVVPATKLTPSEEKTSLLSFPWKWFEEINWQKWIPWNININDNNMRQIKLEGEVEVDGITSIDVDAVVSNVRFHANIEDDEHISYLLKGKLSERNEEPEIQVKVDEGMLTLAVVYEEKSVSSKNLNLDIYLPVKEYEKIKTQVQSGAINLKQIDVKAIDLETNTGSIYIHGGYDKVKCQVGTGNITAVVDKVGESMDMVASTGNINASIANGLKYVLDMSTQTGNIIHRDVKESSATFNHSVVDYSDGDEEAPEINITANTGNITISHY